MESCVGPGCCIKVPPAGAMTDAGVETVFDLRHVGSGKILDTDIQVGEEAFAVMRSGDKIILRAVQHKGLTGSLVQGVEDRSRFGEKAEGLIGATLAHEPGPGVPAAHV